MKFRCSSPNEVVVAQTTTTTAKYKEKVYIHIDGKEAGMVTNDPQGHVLWDDAYFTGEYDPEGNAIIVIEKPTKLFEE